MFARLSPLLAAIVITAPVIFGKTDENEAMEICNERAKRLKANEDKYTRRGERSPLEPDLFEPQFKDKKILVHEKELRQFPFECLSDLLQIYNSSSLKGNDKYEKMENDCKAKQFQPNCDPNYPYRTHNGMCNNLEHPNWGASLSCGSRKTQAYYVGASGFRRSLCNNQSLPNPRKISKLYMTDLPIPDLPSSSHFIYFGQFLTHDILDTPVTFVEEKHLECCKNRHWPDHHPQCAPILLGFDPDYVGLNINVTCFNFIRAAMCDTCSIGKRSHINEVSSFIDLSVVYGIDDAHSATLRTNHSGLLRSRNHLPAGELMPKTDLIDPSRCGLHVVPGFRRKKRDLTSVEELTECEEGSAECAKEDAECTEESAECAEESTECTKSVAESAKDAAKNTKGDVESAKDSVESVTDAVQQHCFEGGDRRANQHTVLMIYHTVWLRNHNRIAKKLESLNPHWDDEKLYQEARKINIAMFQVIVFKEYLPHLLRSKYMAESKLSIGHGTRTEYHPKMNPSIWVEFAAAAFRLHTMIDRKVGLLELDLRYLFQDTSHLYLGKIEKYLAGLVMWPYKNYGKQIAQDLHKYTYKERLGLLGFDLASVNIQRGRDVGLPPYVDLVKFISHGKIDIKDFAGLARVMTPEKILLLKAIYCDVRDIDAWIGLNSETKEPGMIIPTTAAKIIAHQFRSLKFGDRFYFEHPKHFTDAQLKELLKSSLSRVFCDTTKFSFAPANSIQAIGPNNMLLPCLKTPEVDSLPKVDALPKLDLLPKVDLSLWKEEKKEQD